MDCYDFMSYQIRLINLTKNEVKTPWLQDRIYVQLIGFDITLFKTDFWIGVQCLIPTATLYLLRTATIEEYNH